MKTILITGGTGEMGKALIPRLQKQGHIVRIMSRKEPPSNLKSDIEWAQADGASGASLDNAVQGVDTIIHLLSDIRKTKEIDVEGTRRITQIEQKTGVAHFIYLSIVGIEKFNYAYYKAKLAAEKIIQQSNIPWSIVRAAQFHSFVGEWMIPAGLKWPIPILPAGIQFQLIDSGEVANFITQRVAVGFSQEIENIAGPKVQSIEELAPKWLAVHGIHKKIRYIKVPLEPFIGYRQGHNILPGQGYGKITWQDWLEKKQ